MGRGTTQLGYGPGRQNIGDSGNGLQKRARDPENGLPGHAWHPPMTQGKLGLALQEYLKLVIFSPGAGPGPIGMTTAHMFLRPAPLRLRTYLPHINDKSEINDYF